MADELHGKFGLVTGGSRGIGAATARQLAVQGASVIVNYAGNKAAAESVVAEITSLGGSALAVQADVSDEAGVATMFAAVDPHFGGHSDILVNNAGIYKLGTIQESGIPRFLLIVNSLKTRSGHEHRS